MVEHILGNYLVDSGKITKEQLGVVLQKQDSARVKLGLIAVSEGMMTSKQAEEVNMMQSVRDKRFGDIAIERGYLNEEQVERLLKEQGSAYLTFVQTLIDEELIQMDELECFLSDFKRLNNYSNTDLEAIKSDEIDRILPLMLPESAQEMLPLIGTVIRTMVRLVDRHIYVGKAAMVDTLPNDNLVLQKLEGAKGLVDCFAERNGALLSACSIFGQEEFEKLDSDALDAAGELLNCINGMYVSELSRQGRFLELMPPEYAPVNGVSGICRVPVFMGNKGLYFTVGKMN